MSVSIIVNEMEVKHGAYLSPGVVTVDYSNSDAGDVPFLEG